MRAFFVVLSLAEFINAQQFNLYPAVSSDLFATALNISSGCLTALNATVNCDQDLFSMAGNVDGFFWSDENATALCTGECTTSASSWWSNAADACADDQLNAYGRVYPAETVPGRFVDGLNVVCVTATTNVTEDPGISGSVLTVTDLGETNSTVNETGFDQTVPSYPGLDKRQASTSQFCLIQSYDWAGSDIIRPDCTDPANAGASQCIDPTDVPPENERIANLYPDDLLCSQCFLNLFYLRLASPYLPDADYSDYLVGQWFDIVDVCNVNSSAPDLLVRSLPFYDYAPGEDGGGIFDVTDGNGDPLSPQLTASGNNQTYNATCQDRTIYFADLEEPTVTPNVTIICDVVAQLLNASTGDVYQMFGNPLCQPDFDTDDIPAVCAPPSCSVVPMPANTTCDQFASTLSTGGSNGTVTTTQFLSWNPNLIGICDITTEQYVCGDAPGGTYISPPASNSSTNAGTQQRGGGDGSGTATGSGGVGGAGRNSTIVQPGGTPPSPTQSGIPASCTQYAQAQSGDGCYSFSQDFTITQQALEQWNPVLGSNGENCTTEFFAGYWYCIGVQSPTSTSSTSTVAASTSSTPSPVQSGIDSQCTLYAEAVSGDTCSGFASENGITTDQLYYWNPTLGTDGANCGSEFWANEYYCVGAPDSPSSTQPTATSTAAAVPSPTQSGIASNCDSYAEAISGDTCSGFAQEHGVTTTDLYTWNTVLGPNGEDCNTNLYVGYYYCIGVSGASN